MVGKSKNKLFPITIFQPFSFLKTTGFFYVFCFLHLLKKKKKKTFRLIMSRAGEIAQKISAFLVCDQAWFDPLK